MAKIFTILTVIQLPHPVIPLRKVKQGKAISLCISIMTATWFRLVTVPLPLTRAIILLFDSQMLWRLNLTCDLWWRRWNDQSIVFNVASGQTHYLSELAVTVFESLQQRPSDAATLIQYLVEHYDSFYPDDEDVRTHFDTLLANLDDLGLIEPDRL